MEYVLQLRSKGHFKNISDSRCNRCPSPSIIRMWTKKKKFRTGRSMNLTRVSKTILEECQDIGGLKLQNPIYIEGNAPVLDPSRIEHLRFAQEFSHEVSRATLNNGRLDNLTIDNLRYPDETPVGISDPDTCLSLNIFLSCKNASEQIYTDIRDSILMRYPCSGILSYHDIKNLVAKNAGVCAVYNDLSAERP